MTPLHFTMAMSAAWVRAFAHWGIAPGYLRGR